MTNPEINPDTQQIRAMIARWAEAVRAQNLSSVIADRSADILMFDVPPPTQLQGIAAYEQSWLPLFKCFGEESVFDVNDLAVHVGGDVAFATALVRCCAEEAHGERVEICVRLTMGLRKLGGEWKVVHEHHSVPATD